MDLGLPIVSLVGYTNAGKSTLMNALAQSTEVKAKVRELRSATRYENLACSWIFMDFHGCSKEKREESIGTRRGSMEIGLRTASSRHWTQHGDPSPYQVAQFVCSKNGWVFDAFQGLGADVPIILRRFKASIPHAS